MRSLVFRWVFTLVVMFGVLAPSLPWESLTHNHETSCARGCCKEGQESVCCLLLKGTSAEGYCHRKGGSTATGPILRSCGASGGDGAIQPPSTIRPAIPERLAMPTPGLGTEEPLSAAASPLLHRTLPIDPPPPRRLPA